MTNTDKFIEITNFHKSFGSKAVIKDLNFNVKKGEIFTFLGANGSGKTTTIRCLLNIYQADSGTLKITGKNYSREMSNILGYLPEERGLYLDSKVIDTLIYFGRLKNMSASSAKKRSEEFLEQIGLADKRNEQIKNLSSGQQQKIQLGITLVNEPELLILDEPTKGLDPVNRNLLMEILLDLNENKNTTILFSTHLMEEAEKIADRLVMIKNGERKLYGTVAEVRNSFGKNNIQIEFSGNLKESTELFKIRDREKNYAELVLRSNNIEVNDVLSELIEKQNLEIYKFEKAAPSLQDIFVQVSENEGNNKEANNA
jgi:ABC-2 type transport system ATP-binding protein